MQEQIEPREAIRDIRQMMEKSSRFISLSGWSGVSAGICALASAVYVGSSIECWRVGDCLLAEKDYYSAADMRYRLIWIGLVTFIVALSVAFTFTYIRSRKKGVPIWGFTARKMIINVAIPLLTGGLVTFRLMQMGYFGLVAPCCLVFYGLALINASKYTLTEIRYLGIGQVVLGLINLWLPAYGLYFWAAGFGLLHIIYGFIMWLKYERSK
jgi:hypothetical protein